MSVIHKFQSTRPIRGTTHGRNQGGAEGTAFQSTRPIRGTTSVAVRAVRYQDNFNPRAPYGARHIAFVRNRDKDKISIHAPHTGHDSCSDVQASRLAYFNPRAPYGARPASAGMLIPTRHFNPRAPYGARQQKCIIYVLHFCNNRQSKHKNQQETSSVRTFF